ncbi:MAG: DUF4231 domain-containing protein [Gloeocapsa sp. UFS-A4-WI-NPMV-4B04]|jgi:hypothetical protein|nr:DUF4231 domain-containing protein [Gloeocapsa sp. UFS-A4-WI-NPMV-4B04]
MELNELLEKWLNRAYIVLAGHHEAAGRFQSLHNWIGIPTIILSTLVGTSIFATLQEKPNISLKIAAGIASVMSAILASLQTFLRFEERAERHRKAGNNYSVLMRELEQETAFPTQNSEELEKFVTNLRERWNQLNAESPTIPRDIWQRVNR